MAVKFSSSSLSCVANSLSPPFKSRMSSKMTFSQRPRDRQRFDILQLQSPKVKSSHFIYGLWRLQGGFRKRQNVLFAISEDQSDYIEISPGALEQVNQHPNLDGVSLAGSSSIHYEGSNGKPGLISFYNRPYKRENEINTSNVQKSQSSLVWLVGPAVLVASFIFPSLYLRRIISMIFEDSLLTDFLLLFFTEALF